MSMCTPCKQAADEMALRRESGNDMVRLHACAYPHSCTCQHDRREPVPAEVDW